MNVCSLYHYELYEKTKFDYPHYLRKYHNGYIFVDHSI